MRCFLIGHRDAEEWLIPQLEAVIRKHIVEYGVTEFVVGQYGAFDRMAARIILKEKLIFPQISLCILLPYHPDERRICAPEGYDNTIYPPGMECVPRRFAIARADRYMVMHSEYLIIYAWQPGSNSKRLLDFALRQHEITITQLKNPYMK